MAESSQKEIQVRALTGESIVLHIPPTGTVHDLKLLLIQSFPPATHYPNFHLFSKARSPSSSFSFNFVPLLFSETSIPIIIFFYSSSSKLF